MDLQHWQGSSSGEYLCLNFLYLHTGYSNLWTTVEQESSWVKSPPAQRWSWLPENMFPSPHPTFAKEWDRNAELRLEVHRQPFPFPFLPKIPTQPLTGWAQDTTVLKKSIFRNPLWYTYLHLDLESGEGNGTPLQYSCLENPMDGGAWWAAVHGVTRSQTWLSDFTFTFHFHALEKEMATHSSVLAWRIPGTGDPGGLPSMGSHRVGHNWSDLAAADLVSICW